MTMRELAQQCIDALNNPGRSAGCKIVLLAPTRGGMWPKGGGPRGRCVGSQRNRITGKTEYIL